MDLVWHLNDSFGQQQQQQQQQQRT